MNSDTSLGTNSEDTNNDMVATSPIRESAVLAAINEETNIDVVATSPIRERAVLAAINEESNDYLVATSPIRERAVLAAKYEETNDYLVATSPIRESAVLAAINEETNDYLVATSSIRERAVLAAINEETTEYSVATSSIRESAVLAAINEETTEYSVATFSIGESAVPAAKYEFTNENKFDKSELLLTKRENYEQNSELKCLNTMLMNERGSRYSKYIGKINYCDRRDRAPSRIPAKRLSRVLCKSRSVRRFMRKYIKKEIPRSSHVHRLLYASSHERKRLLSDRVMYLPQASLMKHRLLKVCDLKCSSRWNRISRTKKCFRSEHMSTTELRQLIYKTKNISIFALRKAYTSLNHRSNCCKFSLCTDIEKNPGPTFIEPNKTLHAPYSQDFEDVFHENAGKQCVAMSLCALLYKYSKGSITCSADLVTVMGIGNELYSMLSRITGQDYLLLT